MRDRSGVSQFYLDHYGFATRPFSILPDPEMLFWSDLHRRAFAVLEYGLMSHAPLTVVTGEVGTGKTTLMQALLKRLEGELRVGLISNARGDRGDLLRWVLNAFDVPAPAEADYVRLFQTFQDFVLAEYARGKRVVLIFDEAQNLGPATLEELRMLTNMNAGRDEMLQLVLLGQPELREIITRPELRQFAQRVSATFHLRGFHAETTAAYVAHRLQKAGGTGAEIDADAVALIHAHAGGIPRLVNTIADLALVYGAVGGHNPVTGAVVQELIDDGLILTAGLPGAAPAVAPAPAPASAAPASPASGTADAGAGDRAPDAPSPGPSPAQAAPMRLADPALPEPDLDGPMPPESRAENQAENRTGGARSITVPAAAAAVLSDAVLPDVTLPDITLSDVTFPDAALPEAALSLQERR